MLPSIFRNIGKECWLTSTESNFLGSYINYQCVRWRRKPRWLPVAKSKVFRIPEKPVIPEEEYMELKRLHNNYKTEMKSLRAFFASRTRESLTGQSVIAEQERLEEEEYQKCLKLNDEWNANIAVLRIARIEKEKEIELENIIKKIEENKKLEAERKQKLELVVRQEKERSKNYITENNIDEAIEKALSNVIDYDFSIDLEGNKYMGRLTKPTTSKTKSISPGEASA